MESKWIFRSAVLCLLVGTCIAQFQPRQQNPFLNQQQQRSFEQRPNDYFVQQPQSFAGNAQCPEPNGRFPVASQCDAYVECVDGVGEEKLCPEGLLFNPEARFNYPCGYPIDVKCEGRSALQPAQPSEECPHQYGYFKMGDQRNCGKFMNCVEGRGYVFDCPEGLAYNPETYRCDWPDQVNDCDAEAFLGFTCPTSGQSSFLHSEARFYRSPNDCQRYYVCVNNRPRLQNCGEGNAFNDLIGTCDAAENVTGCEPPFRKNLETLNLIDIRSQNDEQHIRSAKQQQSYNHVRNFDGFQQQQYQQQQQHYRGSQTFNSQGNNQYAKSRF
ncbi:protein obstructor-E-like [Phymastichus coffea]|uniref:protein obstructor-E-like n=1 Tax=Phymastichus coffea TaxID=108790 RepID=UPI00273AD5F6|nr:protein obstructor-E-like [Phymastichus coffea]